MASALFLRHDAWADDATVTVLVLVPAEGDALASRVEAELRALGFLVTMAKDEGAEKGELERTARNAGAAAAIRVVRSDEGAEVWVADRITGKTLLRNVQVEPGEDREGVLAVRAVELLRASLLEIEATHAPRGDVVAPPIVHRVVSATRASPSHFALAVGLGPQLSASVSPAFHAYASVAWTPTRLGLEITGLIPVAPAQLCRAAGCAELSAGLIGGGGRLLLSSASSRIRPEVALGFAAAIVHATGQAQAGFTPPVAGVGATVVSATIYGRATLAFALTRELRLGLDVLAGSALPPPAVRFAGTEIARWGGPFGSLLLHSEVAF